VVAVAVGAVVLGRGPLRAQGAEEPEPCSSTVRLGDANRCWAREAERADSEMTQTYLAAVDKLSRPVAEKLKKAQKLWLEFRNAEVAALFGEANPRGTYGPEYPMCVSIARWKLARARTRQLKRLLQPDEDSLCPL
jgi:uncharacterized protein YecT (DUF1311 family)